MKLAGIQQAVLSDVPAVMDILDACRQDLAAKGVLQWCDTYPTASIVREGILRGGTHVASVGPQFVATVTADRELSREYETLGWSADAAQSGCVHRLAVHPLFQGQGFGRQLMVFVEDLLRKQGIRAIRLDAYSQNPVAMALYDSLAYHRRGEVFFPGRDAPFVCFEKLP